MKTFVKQKKLNFSEIITLVVIVVLVVVLTGSSLTEAKKIQYGELLTNDNELFLVEKDNNAAGSSVAKKAVKPVVKKQQEVEQPVHPIVRRSAESSIKKSSNNKTTTPKSTTKKSTTTKKPTTTTTTSSQQKLADTNKLIVNIVYTSSNSEAAARSDLTRLVYSTSESLSACDKAPCKSNEVCILMDKKTDGKNEDYKCVPKSKLALLPDKPTTTTTTKKKSIQRRQVNSYANPECTPFVLTLIRLHLFEIYDTISLSSSSSEDEESSSSSTVQPVTALLFAKLDSNRNGEIDLYEWLATSEMQAIGTCADALFFECDADLNRLVSVDELGACLGGAQARPVCAYLRDPNNVNFADEFLKRLSAQLAAESSSSSSSSSLELTRVSFVPICDDNGYFVAHQCNTKVTCWCMTRTGQPVPHSLRHISESQINCDDFS